ncbi:MAG: C40 family peptidase [Magnetococcales bacterium]|nr:C40 family peptidase [Magnetococcales bacterium]
MSTPMSTTRNPSCSGQEIAARLAALEEASAAWQAGFAGQQRALARRHLAFTEHVERVLAAAQPAKNERCAHFCERLVYEGRMPFSWMNKMAFVLAALEEEPTITFTEQDGTENRQSLMEVVRDFLAWRPVQYNRPVPGLLDSATAKLRAQLDARSHQLYQRELLRWCPELFAEPASKPAQGSIGPCKSQGEKDGPRHELRCCDSEGKYSAGTPISADEAEKMLETARTHAKKNTPYNGFDCSTSTRKIFGKHGYVVGKGLLANDFHQDPFLPEVRGSVFGGVIQPSKLQPGDIVQFTGGGHVHGHLMIWDPLNGEGSVLHASSVGYIRESLANMLKSFKPSTIRILRAHKCK